MKTAVLGALTLASLLLAGTARAQTLGETPVASNTLGGVGQVTIAGDFAINFVHNTDADASDLVLAPAFDYFIAPQLSLGGQVVFGYATDNVGSRTSIGFGPRVGYNIPLREMFSLYPRVGFGFLHESVSLKGGGSGSGNAFTLTLYAPFLFHPVPHFFIGLGPAADIGIAGSAKTTQIALITTVGGWFEW